MTSLSVCLVITDVSSRGRNGGAIFTGLSESGERYGVILDYHLLSDSTLIDRGQRWQAEGTEEIWSGTVRGRLVKRRQIRAKKARLLKPGGQNIIHWISRSPDCAGIGLIKAKALWNVFGDSLAALIESRDIDALTSILTSDSAEIICNAFKKHQTLESLMWLDQIGIPQRIGLKVVDYYQDRLEAEIKQNPYVLLAFEGKWKVIDAFARERLGIPCDDPRRLEAAVEEQLYRGLSQGHTCLPKAVLIQGARRLVSENLKDTLKSENQRWHRFEDTFQASGPYAIEKFISDRLVRLATGESSSYQQPLFDTCKSHKTLIEEALKQFQSQQGFELTVEQKQAVVTSASFNISLILDDAGCGKPTVLKALYFVLEELYSEVAIFQVALAGLAAQRMAEATGRDAYSLAGLLAGALPETLPANSVVVCDEMSMVDTLIFYRFLRWLPQGCRLILIGDPAKLPPIGPGLVLHVLQGNPRIPQTTLKITKRQHENPGIPSVASKVRDHQVPEFIPYKGFGQGVSFVRCNDSDLNQAVWLVYRQIGGTAEDFSVQILCPTRGGLGGAQQINQIWHDGYRRESEKIHCFDLYEGNGVVPAATSLSATLRVGDLVMFTENNHELGLRNGSLGKIVEALRVRDARSECCTIEWEDGRKTSLTTKHVNSLTHAYGLTIHKSHGSQFNRVIIPIRQSRLLNQALIYTALASGVSQVVFVGDEAATIAAITKPSIAGKRYVGLRQLLQRF